MATKKISAVPETEAPVTPAAVEAAPKPIVTVGNERPALSLLERNSRSKR